MSDELAVRRLTFFLLLAFAPAFVFLGQAVLFLPAAAILASAMSMLWLIVVDGEQESLVIIAFFVAHFLLFAVVYWLVAFFVGKLTCLLRNRIWSWAIAAVVTCAIGIVSQLSLYGSGGHGATKLYSLQGMFTRDTIFLSVDYFWFYAVSVATIGAVLLIRSSGDSLPDS